jgi:acetylornithine deacetylase
MNRYRILADLVRFNTVGDKENNELINYIENYLLNLGFRTEYKTKDLVMTYGSNPGLGFLGHTDTVEYVDDFKTPFELREQDGFLYGLGACDMKGGIAAFLDAITNLDLSKLKRGINLYFTYDEERFFGGIDELNRNNISFPEYMIFGEPTNNEIFVGHKGILEYRINFEGRKAHSSTPDKGISANMNAVKFVNELDDFYNNEIRTEEVYDYEVPYTTMNLGILRGGTARNSIPAFCEIGLDFRIAKREHIERITAKVEELANRYRASIEILQKVEPFADDIEFLEAKKTTNFMTEAAEVRGAKRMILGTGPVTAHEVNEHISTESYDKLVNQYTELIERICG